MARQRAASEAPPSVAQKRKRESTPGPPAVVTYNVSNGRSFARVLKEDSFEDFKRSIRLKLGLEQDDAVQLAQSRDGKRLDLQDDDDFEALQASATHIPMLEVDVLLDESEGAAERVVKPRAKKAPKKKSPIEAPPRTSLEASGSTVLPATPIRKRTKSKVVQPPIIEEPIHDPAPPSPPKKKRKKKIVDDPPEAETPIAGPSVVERKKKVPKKHRSNSVAGPSQEVRSITPDPLEEPSPSLPAPPIKRSRKRANSTPAAVQSVLPAAKKIKLLMESEVVQNESPAAETKKKRRKRTGSVILPQPAAEVPDENPEEELVASKPKKKKKKEAAVDEVALEPSQTAPSIDPKDAQDDSAVVSTQEKKKRKRIRPPAEPLDHPIVEAPAVDQTVDDDELPPVKKKKKKTKKADADPVEPTANEPSPIKAPSRETMTILNKFLKQRNQPSKPTPKEPNSSSIPAEYDGTEVPSDAAVLVEQDNPDLDGLKPKKKKKKRKVEVDETVPEGDIEPADSSKPKKKKKKKDPGHSSNPVQHGEQEDPFNTATAVDEDNPDHPDLDANKPKKKWQAEVEEATPDGDVDELETSSKKKRKKPGLSSNPVEHEEQEDSSNQTAAIEHDDPDQVVDKPKKKKKKRQVEVGEFENDEHEGPSNPATTVEQDDPDHVTDKPKKKKKKRRQIAVDEAAPEVEVEELEDSGEKEKKKTKRKRKAKRISPPASDAEEDDAEPEPSKSHLSTKSSEAPRIPPTTIAPAFSSSSSKPTLKRRRLSSTSQSRRRSEPRQDDDIALPDLDPDARGDFFRPTSSQRQRVSLLLDEFLDTYPEGGKVKSSGALEDQDSEPELELELSSDEGDGKKRKRKDSHSKRKAREVVENLGADSSEDEVAGGLSTQPISGVFTSTVPLANLPPDVDRSDDPVKKHYAATEEQSQDDNPAADVDELDTSTDDTSSVSSSDSSDAPEDGEEPTIAAHRTVPTPLPSEVVAEAEDLEDQDSPQTTVAGDEDVDELEAPLQPNHPVLEGASTSIQKSPLKPKKLQHEANEDDDAIEDVPEPASKPRSPSRQVASPQRKSLVPHTPPISPIQSTSPWQTPSQPAQTQSQFSFRLNDDPLFLPTQAAETQKRVSIPRSSPHGRSPPKSQSLKHVRTLSLDSEDNDAMPAKAAAKDDLEKQVTRQQSKDPFLNGAQSEREETTQQREDLTKEGASASSQSAAPPNAISSEDTLTPTRDTLSKRLAQTQASVEEGASASTSTLTAASASASASKRPSREERAAVQRERAEALAVTPKTKPRNRTPGIADALMTTPRYVRGRKVVTKSRSGTPTEPLSATNVEWAEGYLRGSGGMTNDSLRNLFSTEGVPLGLRNDSKDKLIGLAIELMKKEPARFEKLKRSRLTGRKRSSVAASLPEDDAENDQLEDQLDTEKEKETEKEPGISPPSETSSTTPEPEPQAPLLSPKKFATPIKIPISSPMFAPSEPGSATPRPSTLTRNRKTFGGSLRAFNSDTIRSSIASQARSEPPSGGGSKVRRSTVRSGRLEGFDEEDDDDETDSGSGSDDDDEDTGTGRKEGGAMASQIPAHRRAGAALRATQ